MKLAHKLAIGIAAAFLAAHFFPKGMGEPFFAVAGLAPVMLMLAVILLRALKRQEDLAEWVSIELNKIRRVYHIGKNLGVDARLRPWFTELHGFLYGYLSAFDKKDFSQYQETNGEFRKLSYHLYTIPDLTSEKERVLYRDLVDTAGKVAEARQRIHSLWNGALPKHVWYALKAVLILALTGILWAGALGGTLSIALLLSVAVSVFILVHEIDQHGYWSGTALAKKYVENLARLELKR